MSAAKHLCSCRQIVRLKRLRRSVAPLEAGRFGRPALAQTCVFCARSRVGICVRAELWRLPSSHAALSIRLSWGPPAWRLTAYLLKQVRLRCSYCLSNTSVYGSFTATALPRDCQRAPVLRHSYRSPGRDGLPFFFISISNERGPVCFSTTVIAFRHRRPRYGVILPVELGVARPLVAHGLEQ